MYKVPHQFKDDKRYKSMSIIQKSILYHGITGVIMYNIICIYMVLFSYNEFNRTFLQRFTDEFIALFVFNFPLCIISGFIIGNLVKNHNKNKTKKHITLLKISITISLIILLSLNLYSDIKKSTTLVFINVLYMIPGIILLNHSSPLSSNESTKINSPISE